MGHWSIFILLEKQSNEMNVSLQQYTTVNCEVSKTSRGRENQGGVLVVLFGCQLVCFANPMEDLPPAHQVCL